MQILKFLYIDLVFPNFEAADQEQLFNKMCEVLHEQGFVKESFLEGISNREKIYPTGLEMGYYGCAIPHTDIEHVIKPAIAVATLKKPIEFSVMGDPDSKVEVNVVFMLALNRKNDQVVMLQDLGALIQNTDAIAKIRKATSREEVLNIIKNSSK